MPDLSQTVNVPLDGETSIASISDIRVRLGKRGTFEGAAAELTVLLLRQARQLRLDNRQRTERPAQQATWDAVARVSTLLRTRFEPYCIGNLCWGQPLVACKHRSSCRFILHPK